MLHLVAMTAVAWQQWVTTDRLNRQRVCPDDPLHAQFTCAVLHVCCHKHQNTPEHKFKSVLLNRHPNKQRAAHGVATPPVMSLLSWKPRVGIVFFFFHTPENSSFLSSFFSHLSHLPPLLPDHVSSALPDNWINMQEGQWTRTCMRTHKTHTHTRTLTGRHKPQPLPTFMLRLAQPDFIRDLDIATSFSF